MDMELSGAQILGLSTTQRNPVETQGNIAQSRLVPLSLEDKILTIMYDTIQEFPYLGAMLDRLDKKVPSDRTFHNRAHTIEVVYHTTFHALLAGESESVIKALVKAAVYHDASHLIPDVKGSDHEPTAARLAREDMSAAGEPADEIERVCNAILDTQLIKIEETNTREQQKGSEFSKYLLDGDLSSFGSRKFFFGALNYWTELSGSTVTSFQDLKGQKALDYLRETWRLIDNHRWQTVPRDDQGSHAYQDGKAVNLVNLAELIDALEKGDDSRAEEQFKKMTFDPRSVLH